MLLHQISPLPAKGVQRPSQRPHMPTGLRGRHGCQLFRRTALPAAPNAGGQQSSVGTVTADSATGAPAVPADGPLEVTLRGVDALQTVRFGLVPQGKGQAVVVTDVDPGSRAEELGVRRGQKLAALSDPMRYGSMWPLEDRPSLRFVVDTLKMRRASPVDLAFEPLLSEADMDAIFGGADAAAAANGSYSGSARAASTSADSAAGVGAAAAAASAAPQAPSSSSPAAIDMVPDNAASSITSIDQLVGSGSESDGESTGMTIGERLAAKRAAALRAQMSNNQVQARIERRKAYMEIDDQRDDTGLLLGLAAAFLLPALVILVVAYFTGYLDRLYLTALTLR